MQGGKHSAVQASTAPGWLCQHRPHPTRRVCPQPGQCQQRLQRGQGCQEPGQPLPWRRDARSWLQSVFLHKCIKHSTQHFCCKSLPIQAHC